MNVYDFDGTIYNGDSSVDLFIFSIKNKKVGVFNFFKILFYTILYKIKIVNTKKYKEIFLVF